MSKPDLKQVLEVLEMKKHAASLYEYIAMTASLWLEEYGDGRFDYDLEQFIDENSDNDELHELIGVLVDDMKQAGRYLKLELTDNIKRMQSGETVFKTVAVKPVAFSSRGLKRCPESLK